MDLIIISDIFVNKKSYIYLYKELFINTFKISLQDRFWLKNLNNSLNNNIISKINIIFVKSQKIVYIKPYCTLSPLLITRKMILGMPSIIKS